MERNFDLIGDVPPPRLETRDGFALVIHESADEAAPTCVVDYFLRRPAPGRDTDWRALRGCRYSQLPHAF
jgi:hypothetical protein